MREGGEGRRERGGDGRRKRRPLLNVQHFGSSWNSICGLHQ